MQLMEVRIIKKQLRLGEGRGKGKGRGGEGEGNRAWWQVSDRWERKRGGSERMRCVEGVAEVEQVEVERGE